MDNNAKRLDRLYEMIPYVIKENNAEELERIKAEIFELSGNTIDDKIPEYDPNNPSDGEALNIDIVRKLFKEKKFDKAKEFVDRGLSLYPYSRELLYMLASLEKEELYKFYAYDEHFNDVETREDKLVAALYQAARDTNIFRGNSEITHRMFCSIGKYGEARDFARCNASVSADFGKYDEAYEWYRIGLDFDMAEKMLEEKKIYEQFKAEVGDEHYYLLNQLGKKCSSELDENERLDEVIKSHPKSTSWLCVIPFVISFILSLVLNFELSNTAEPIVTIGFIVSFAMGVIFMSKERFRIGRAIGILIATLLITVVSYNNIFWELSPVLSKLPKAIILNIAAFAAAIVHLIRKLKSLPGEISERKKKVLVKYLENKCNEFRANLHNKYDPLVGHKRATEWMRWMRNPKL